MRSRPDSQRGPAVLLLLLALPLLVSWELLERREPDVERGNQLYRRGDHQGALRAYDQVVPATHDEKSRLALDKGLAQYQLAGQSSEKQAAELIRLAADSFRAATEARDPDVAAVAYYNLGNVLVNDGQLEEAVAAYRKSLRVRPENYDARYNLELALRRLDDVEKSKPGGGESASQGEGDEGDGESPDKKSADGDPGTSADGAGDEPPEPEPGQGNDEGEGDADPPESAPEPPREDPMPPDEGGGGESTTPAASGPQAMREVERKLDALERRSRDLRKRLLKRDPKHGAGGAPGEMRKDW